MSIMADEVCERLEKGLEKQVLYAPKEVLLGVMLYLRSQFNDQDIMNMLNSMSFEDDMATVKVGRKR